MQRFKLCIYWVGLLACEHSFNHIVVDRVETVFNSLQRVMDVVFMSTFEGVMYKYVVLRPTSTSRSSTADSEACLMERIKVTPVHQTIASLTFDKRNVSIRKWDWPISVIRFLQGVSIAMQSPVLAIDGLSVCPSVARWLFVKTTQARITKSLPTDSPRL